MGLFRVELFLGKLGLDQVAQGRVLINSLDRGVLALMERRKHWDFPWIALIWVLKD